MRLARLKEHRLRRGFSQIELSARARVDRAAISQYEADARGAQGATARRLAEALGVEVEQLLGVQEAGGHLYVIAPPKGRETV